jgi:hypothetical protein
MKKTLLLLAMTFCLIANAQKGTYLVSGSASYYSDKNSDDNAIDNQNFGFNPKLGYQLDNSWAIGLEKSINQSKWYLQSSTNNYLSKRDNFSIGSFLRYSKSLNDSFSLFTDLGIGFQNRKEVFSNDTFPETTSKSNGFYATLQPLIHLKIKNGFGMNFGLGGISYNSMTNKESDNTNSVFYINFGQAYTIGIQKNF